MKISILIDQAMPAAKPLTREEKVAKILKRIEYAADCIEYNDCKPQAIKFLQELYLELSTHKHMREDTQMLMEECYKKIRDYGILPILPKTEEKEE